MTDRVDALTVVLDGDYRDDDVEAVVDAIRMIKGVASVHSHVRSGEELIRRARLAAELKGELYDAIQQIFDPKRDLSSPPSMRKK